MSQNKSFADKFFEQAALISKAKAYDILVEQVKELKEQNAVITDSCQLAWRKVSELCNDQQVKELKARNDVLADACELALRELREFYNDRDSAAIGTLKKALNHT